MELSNYMLLILIYSNPQNKVEKGIDFFGSVLDFFASFYYKSSSINEKGLLIQQPT